jgi:hypothetical protein
MQLALKESSVEIVAIRNGAAFVAGNRICDTDTLQAI